MKNPPTTMRDSDDNPESLRSLSTRLQILLQRGEVNDEVRSAIEDITLSIRAHPELQKYYATSARSPAATLALAQSAVAAQEISTAAERKPSIHRTILYSVGLTCLSIALSAAGIYLTDRQAAKYEAELKWTGQLIEDLNQLTAAANELKQDMMSDPAFDDPEIRAGTAGYLLRANGLAAMLSSTMATIRFQPDTKEAQQELAAWAEIEELRACLDRILTSGEIDDSHFISGIVAEIEGRVDSGLITKDSARAIIDSLQIRGSCSDNFDQSSLHTLRMAATTMLRAKLEEI